MSAIFPAFVLSILILSSYSAIQILSENRRTESGRYLLGVIVLLALSQIPPFLQNILPGGTGRIFELFPTRHWAYLIGPAVYQYARTSMGKTTRLSDLLHLIPMLLWWGLFLILFRDTPPPGFLIVRIYGFTTVLSLVIYGILILVSLADYTKHLRRQYSYRDIFLEIKWLSCIAAIQVIITLLLTTAVSLLHGQKAPVAPPVHKFLGDPEILDRLHSGAVLLFLFIFTLMAQKQERLSPLSVTEKEPVQAERDKPGDLSRELRDLTAFIEGSKIFLNNTLSLQQLSDASGIGRHDLSRLINSETGDNFFHFINGFRAREFCALIENNRYPHYNLLSIAHECGFNSKAPFNAAIKREFNKTPSQLSREIRSAL